MSEQLWSDKRIEKTIEYDLSGIVRDPVFWMRLKLTNIRNDYARALAAAAAEHAAALARIESLEQENKGLYALLADRARAYSELTVQLSERCEYEPLPDGFYLDGVLAIAYDGEDIGLRIDDGPTDEDSWAGNYQWLTDCEIHDVRAKDEHYRVCRCVQREDDNGD